MSKKFGFSVLVPASLYEELIPLVAARVPDAQLTPYDEDPALFPPHAETAEVGGG